MRAPTTSAGGPAPTRSLRTDLVLLGGGAALAGVFACAFVRQPLAAAAAFAALTVAAAVVLFHREIAALSLGRLVAGLALLLPLAALLGPALAHPAAPQLFAFRLLLLLTAALAVPALLLGRRPRHAAAGAEPRGVDGAQPDVGVTRAAHCVPAERVDLRRWRLGSLLALWTGWLAVTLFWAPDKPAGLRYLVVLATMLAVVAAAAASGVSRRRLVLFGATMIVGYVAIVGFTGIEATTGYRLPTSRLLADAGSQSYAVTSVFHNQNDLATYLAICWPFLLGVPFFTRRLRWVALAVVLLVPGAMAFVRTGSRSSLLAVGVATVVGAVVLARPGAWAQTRRAWALGAVLAVGLLAAAGYLLFNESEDPMLRQFRLSGLQRDIALSRGSGEIRTSVYEHGLAIAGGSLLLGVGPGQSAGILTSGTDAVPLGNLHNWWLELYAEGGLPGLALHLAFYGGLLWGLWRRARGPGHPFVRYLAACTFAALVGFVIGALGPSSTLGFAPMWVLYGLGLAVLAVPDGEPHGTTAAETR